MKRATKLLVLEFIRDKEIIRAFDLIEKFGYSEGGAGFIPAMQVKTQKGEG